MLGKENLFVICVYCKAYLDRTFNGGECNYTYDGALSKGAGGCGVWNI